MADRCVVLPGVTLGKGSVLGSGSLAPEDFVAAVGRYSLTRTLTHSPTHSLTEGLTS